MSEPLIFYLESNEITPDPNQPRKRITEDMVDSIAATIKTHGIINPVEIDENNVIVTGEIRWTAAKKIGAKVKCTRWQGLPEERLERQTIENLHHYGLTSIERENAIHGLWKTDRYKSGAKLAETLGYNRNIINVIIAAKEFRDEYLKNVLDHPKISTDSIRITRTLKPEQRVSILEKVAKGEISPRQIPEYVKAAQRSPLILGMMLIGKLDVEQSAETLDIIGQVEDAGVEVSEDMIGNLVQEVMKDESIITRHKSEFTTTTIAVMKGEKPPTTVIAAPLTEFRRIGTTVSRWGFEDLAQLTSNYMEEAREILIGIRDKSISMLSTFFGEAEIVVETDYDVLEKPKRLNQDKAV